MFGFGKKKIEGGVPVVADSGAEEKEILDKVTFHVMPKVGEAAALELANAEEKKDEKSGEHKKESEKPKEAPRASLAPPPPLLAKQPPLPHGAAKISPVAASGGKKWVVAGVIAATLLIILGAGSWYWYRFVRVTPWAERGTLALSPGADIPVEETSDRSTVESPAAPILPPIETHFLADRGLVSSRDSDADLLTDVEEELFGTDPNLPDTDFDGWPDGWEIVHLYDPVQGNARRLIESPLVTAFTNDAYGYAVLYPNTWVAQAVDGQDMKDVLLTSATGEFIQITAEPYVNQATSTLEESYIRTKYPGGSTYTLHALDNKFNVRGFQTADGLTVFLEAHNALYIVRYMPGLRSEINFKRTMAMLVAGFLVNEGVPPAIAAAQNPTTVFDVIEPTTVTSTPIVTTTSTSP